MVGERATETVKEMVTIRRGLLQVDTPRSARKGGGPRSFMPGEDIAGGGGGGWADTLTQVESPRSARPGGGPLVFRPGSGPPARGQGVAPVKR